MTKSLVGTDLFLGDGDYRWFPDYGKLQKVAAACECAGLWKDPVRRMASNWRFSRCGSSIQEKTQ